MLSRRRLPYVSTLALAVTVSTAFAQLSPSGSTIGSFVDLADSNTVVTNREDLGWANFSTGIPLAGSAPSSIDFSSREFANVHSGDLIEVVLFGVGNGLLQPGSGAKRAVFNLGIQLTYPEVRTLPLAQITFALEHTLDSPGLRPDFFSVSYTEEPPVKVGNYLLDFDVLFASTRLELAENESFHMGEIELRFTPVPEPATYGLVGALALAAVAFFRHRSRRRIGLA
jgi:hypothetical protein